MDRPCLDPERLAAALRAPADDPDRRHLESCAWCRALAASRDLFDDLGDLPPGTDVEAADRRLAALLATEVAGRPAARARRFGGPPPRLLFGRRSALAAAAVLLAALGLWLARDAGEPRPGAIKLRDDAGGAPQLALAAPRAVAGGGVELAWSTALRGASFEVVVTTADQTVVATLAAGAGRSRLLTADELAGPRRMPEPLFVEVVARVDGDEAARSLPRLLPDPADD